MRLSFFPFLSLVFAAFVIGGLASTASRATATSRVYIDGPVTVDNPGPVQGETVTARVVLVNTTGVTFSAKLWGIGGRGPRGWENDLQDCGFITDYTLESGYQQEMECSMSARDVGRYQLYAVFQDYGGGWHEVFGSAGVSLKGYFTVHPHTEVARSIVPVPPGAPPVNTPTPPSPPGGLYVAGPVSVDNYSPPVGSLINAKFTLVNDTGADLRVRQMGIGGRGPRGWEQDVQDCGFWQDYSLPARAQQDIVCSMVVRDVGTYTLYAVFEDYGGGWHEIFGRSGHSLKARVDVRAVSPPPQAAPGPPRAPSNSGGRDVVVANAGVGGINIRTGPGRRFEIRCFATNGSVFRQIQGPIRDGTYDWYELRDYSGPCSGWAAGFALKDITLIGVAVNGPSLIPSVPRGLASSDKVLEAVRFQLQTQGELRHALDALDRVATIKDVLSILPLLGDAIVAHETAAGRDLVTDQILPDWERQLNVVILSLNTVGGVGDEPLKAAKVAAKLGAKDFQQLARFTTTSGTYRPTFFRVHPETPSYFKIHHSLPQTYRELMLHGGIDVTQFGYLRGVDPIVHELITLEWIRWDRGLGRSPTPQEIVDFAAEVDRRYGGSFIWP
jgi:hypothetical protein